MKNQIAAILIMFFVGNVSAEEFVRDSAIKSNYKRACSEFLTNTGKCEYRISMLVALRHMKANSQYYKNKQIETYQEMKKLRTLPTRKPFLTIFIQQQKEIAKYWMDSGKLPVIEQ